MHLTPCYIFHFSLRYSIAPANKLLGKDRINPGAARRRISCFMLFSCSLSFSLLDSAFLTTGLSAQHSTARHFAFSFSWRCIIFFLGLLLAPVFGQSKGKKQDCEIIPLLHNLRITRRTRRSMHWLLSVHLLPFFHFWLSAVDIWSLTLAMTPKLSQERGREKDRNINS